MGNLTVIDAESLRKTIAGYEALAERAKTVNKHDRKFYLQRIEAHRAALASLLRVAS